MRLTARLLFMANNLKVGQQLQGKLSIYTIPEQMHSCIWIAMEDPDLMLQIHHPHYEIRNATTMQKVTIKQARP